MEAPSADLKQQSDAAIQLGDKQQFTELVYCTKVF